MTVPDGGSTLHIVGDNWTRGVRVLEIDTLRSAAADFVSAALVGEDWEGALERVALAAGARGAALMRNNKDYKVASVICSPEIRDPVNVFIAGRIPPPSRQTRLDFRRNQGFRFDYDDYTAEELSRDPYYQEFLRPIGFFWHAAISLDSDDGESIALSLKRPLKDGPYERSDALALNSIVPDLRGATRIARGVMNAEGAGVARLLQRRGTAVFELDPWGRVLRTHMFDDKPASPLHVLRGCLVASDRLAQPSLDRAIRKAIARPGRPATVALPDAEGERHYLQIVPVGGHARDIFRATAAVAVQIHRTPPNRTSPFDQDAVRDAFSLTDREIDVALLLGKGHSPADIARALHIRVDTARDHLKSIFQKTDTSRQAELVALLARLRP